MTSIYKPTYQVSINDSCVGYVSHKKDFIKIVKEIKEPYANNSNVKIWLEGDVTYKKRYVKENIIEKANIYSTLQDYIEYEYTFYVATINNNIEIIFDSYESAQKYADNILNNVATATVRIEQKKSKDVIKFTVTDKAQKISDNLISRYKAEINRTCFPTDTTYISSYYGMRWGRLHTGIDLAARIGTNIYSYKTGKVCFSGWKGSYGNCVIIDHGKGLSTLYAHCSKLLVTKGDFVRAGTRIALMGSTGWSTGSHLHFEIRWNNIPVNPYNYIF